jgi:hypothetical protein
VLQSHAWRYGDDSGVSVFDPGIWRAGGGEMDPTLSAIQQEQMKEIINTNIRNNE